MASPEDLLTSWKEIIKFSTVDKEGAMRIPLQGDSMTEVVLKRVQRETDSESA